MTRTLQTILAAEFAACMYQRDLQSIGIHSKVVYDKNCIRVINYGTTMATFLWREG